VAGLREVVEEAVTDGWVAGKGGECPEGRQREGGEEFSQGAALEVSGAEGGGLRAGALSHRGSSCEARERGHRLDGGVLGAREGEAAGERSGFSLAQGPGEDRPVGGAGAGRGEVTKACEGFGLLAVEAEGWVDRRERTGCVEAPEGFFGGGLHEDASELVVEACATDRIEVGDIALEPGEGLGLDLKAETDGVAEGAEYAGGVVLEGPLVQDADEARIEVGAAAGWVENVAGVGAVQAEGEGVDGEVAAH